MVKKASSPMSNIAKALAPAGHKMNLVKTEAPEVKAKEPKVAKAVKEPAAPKEAKVKRDIFGDIKTNEHLRKALWTVKGRLTVGLKDKHGVLHQIGVVKSDIINMLQESNAKLSEPAMFHLEVHPGDSAGATLMDKAPKAVNNAA